MIKEQFKEILEELRQDIEKIPSRTQIHYSDDALASILKPRYHYWDLGEDRFIFSRIKNAFSIAVELLPDYKIFFETFWNRPIGKTQIEFIRKQEVLNTIDYVIGLVDKKTKIEKNVSEGKIFHSSLDKLKQAGESFNKEDWNSTMNNLNTAVELALKVKLGIPITIPKVKTNRIIEIMIKENIGPVDYLHQVKKHLYLDNKVKHIGYSGGKIDCVNALKSVEEFLHRLEKSDINLDEEIKKKIFGNI